MVAKAPKPSNQPIEPDQSYPLHVFLRVANISRAKLRRLVDHAKTFEIDLVRNAGTPTVLGSDYLAYVAKCGPYEIKPRGINAGPGRGHKKNTTGRVATSASKQKAS